MSVVLVRIDDRLVHGQVVEGWLKSIHANHIVVASDLVASDETMKALYLLAVPQGVQLSCLSIAEAAEAWKSAEWAKDRILVLVSSPQEALALAEKGAQFDSLNVGGVHFREGRTQILKAVSVDAQDVSSLRGLAKRGIFLEARPLPLDEPIEVRAYLDRWEQEQQALGDQPK